MLFGLIFIVLSFNTIFKVDDSLYFIDVLPDFIGYLLLWIHLEKRRINQCMKILYTVVSAMTLISFLFFLGQTKVFFEQLLSEDLILIRLLLDGLIYVMANFGDLILLVGVLVLGWLHLAMLKYWERNNQHKLHCTVCKIGMGLCGFAGLCHVGATFILLPFSWHWLSYPASLLAIVTAWFVMKDSQEMLTGTTELVKERLFGGKK